MTDLNHRTIYDNRNNLLFPFLLLLMVSLSFNEARAQEVTFSVNMEHAEVGPGDQVAVRGNIPQLGNWKEEGQLRLQNLGNEFIYEGRLNLGETPGEVLYKFVILRRNGEVQWEEQGNRVLEPGEMQTVWFDDRSTPGIRQPLVQVTVRLDLTGHYMDGLPAENAALTGGREPLDFDLETGRTEMTQVEEGVWVTTVSFLNGTPHDVPFKFAWQHLEQWIWEYRPGHTNHVFWIDDTQTQQTISLRYDAEKGSIEPVPGTSGLVDDYAAIITEMGELGERSRYVYELAMEQLTRGEVEAAQQTYNRYQTNHPGGEEIDDFHYRMVYVVEEISGAEAAIAYIDEQLASEAIPERRDYFEYLKGELNMKAGRQAQARAHFRNVEREGTWEVARRYSTEGIVHSYLMESETDSVSKGIAKLEQLRMSAGPEDQRVYTQQLARAYRQADMEDKEEEMLVELAHTGSPKKQVMSKLQLADNYIRKGRFTEAAGMLDAVKAGSVPAQFESRYIRMRIQTYYHFEAYETVVELIDEFSIQWPDHAYAERFADHRQNAVKQLGEGWLPGEARSIPAVSDTTQNR